MLRQFRRVATLQARSLVRRSNYCFRNEVPKFDPAKDYYQVLGVSKHTPENEVKKAYYRLAKEYHPDSHPGKEGKFKEVNEAYSVLSDPSLKKQYDAARLFTGFGRRMRSKASEGEYHYEEYHNMFKNLSPEEQEEIKSEARRKMRKVLFWGIFLVFMAPFLARKNHKFFVLD
jgi:curved DNA-binding protein CbpA